MPHSLADVTIYVNVLKLNKTENTRNAAAAANSLKL